MEERDLLLKYNLQWFAKEGPGGEKTEPATAKKLKDAREEGKVAKSKEFSGAVDLIVLFLGLKIFGSYVSETLMNEFSGFYRKIPDILLENKTGMTVKSSHISYLLANYLIISVILTPKLSSITTTSPFATYFPFTSTSIGSPAILFNSMIVPGAKSNIS